MGKQLEATAGALVSKQFRITWPKSDTTYLSVILDNRGRTLASEVHAEVTIEEMSALDGKIVKAYSPWRFVVPSINPSAGDLTFERGIYLPLQESGFDMPNVLKLAGTISYFDGFETRSDELCYYVTGSMKFRNKAGAIQQTTGPSTLSCGSLPPQLAYFRETQKQIGSQ